MNVNVGTGIDTVKLKYDDIQMAFLDKISEYDLLDLPDENRQYKVDGYMKRAIAEFRYVCVYNIESYNDHDRVINDDFDPKDVYEIIDIISEGMVLQWLKPYLYSQDNLEMGINTRDYTAYSVQHEILRRVGAAFERIDKNYTHMIREYSYNHGVLTELHQ